MKSKKGNRRTYIISLEVETWERPSWHDGLPYTMDDAIHEVMTRIHDKGMKDPNHCLGRVEFKMATEKE